MSPESGGWSTFFESISLKKQDEKWKRTLEAFSNFSSKQKKVKSCLDQILNSISKNHLKRGEEGKENLKEG